MHTKKAATIAGDRILPINVANIAFIVLIVIKQTLKKIQRRFFIEAKCYIGNNNKTQLDITCTRLQQDKDKRKFY